MSANSVIYHSHHIFPKHIDPKGIFDSYRVRVTVEEHAEIHGLLFDEYWRLEDWVAYNVLLGSITNAEANRLVSSRNGKKWLGRKHRPESKEKIRQWNLNHPEHHSEEWRMKGTNTWRGQNHSEETKHIISLKIRGKPKSQTKNYQAYAKKRLWIVNSKGQIFHTTNPNDPRFSMREYQRGMKWKIENNSIKTIG